MIAEITTRFGDADAPVIGRGWRRAPVQPYRKTYGLLPGQSWFDAETTDKQSERYVLDDAGIAVPVGAMVARELKAEGADEAAFVEIWGGLVLVDQNLVCVSQLEDGKVVCADSHVETGKILTRFLAERGSFKGFPDVIAVFPDGRIALREVKSVSGKDRLGPNQHDAANALRTMFGQRAELVLVEWDFER